MIRWWTDNENFTFGTAYDENVVINAVQVTREQTEARFGSGWVEDKDDILNEWGIDPNRPAHTFANPSDLERFMIRQRIYSAQRNQARFQAQNAGADIDLEEHEPMKTTEKWRPLNPDLIPPLDTDDPPFKMPYQAIEEAQLRLQGSVILVKSQPFYVHTVEAERGDFMLLMTDAKKGKFKLPYSCPDLSLRSPPPGYVVSQEGVVSYFVRVPERVQKQGCAPENTKKKQIGANSWGTFRGAEELLSSLSGRKNRIYTKAIHAHMQEGLIKSVFLTKNVSLFGHDEDVLCEYKGRKLGHVRDGYVVLPGSDRGMSFITRDLRQANLEV